MDDKESLFVFLFLLSVVLMVTVFLWAEIALYAECREVFSVFYCVMNL